MKKGKKIIDKIFMGAVIGGAIGSVVGASVSKKKERKIIKFLKLLLPKKKKDRMKEIPTEK